MDKNAIKKYAVWARTELIERVTQKAQQYEIRLDADPQADSVRGVVLAKEEKTQRAKLIAKVKEKGFDQVIEEVAYIWFNRFSALRFMEVNNILPSRIRVFTDSEGNFKPQILTEAIHLEFDELNMEKVYALKEANKQEELFKYLVIIQCNALSSVLPGMFQKISDYTELLFPDNLLREGSVIEKMVVQGKPDSIPEEDWRDQVQILGWLYQYYNTELKAKVFNRPSSQKIKKEEVPAATQLFTSDWIVRYMVENSLGRMWIEGHPNSNLRSKFSYYLEEAAQDVTVQNRLVTIRKEYSLLKPEDIRVIDPCSGSGHILAYMFDVLMDIYEEYGVQPQDAVKSIIKNNLWGLDIDERASQLAYFSVMMKAVQYDHRYLRREDIPQPHVFAIQESNNIDNFAVEQFVAGNPKLKRDVDILISELHDAKEYGSIINISSVDFEALNERFRECKNEISISRATIELELYPLVQVAYALRQKYHVVVTNPPYMGSSGMSNKLSAFIKKNYPDSKADLFSVFIERINSFVLNNYSSAMITMESWMFLSSFEKLRDKIISNKTIINMVHMPYLGKGGTSLGINFGTSALVMLSTAIQEYSAQYEYIVYYETDSNGVPIQFPTINDRWCTARQSNYKKIPGHPISYWGNDTLANAFYEGKSIEELGASRSGMQTGDNDKFLRLWFEVDYANIKFDANQDTDLCEVKEKWYPQPKGGAFRKWYGNLDYVVNFQCNGRDLRNFTGTSIIKNPQYYFKEGVSWSHTTSKAFSGRYMPEGCIFNVEAPTFYPNEKKYLYYVLGFVNTKILDQLFGLISQTMHYMAGDMAKIPVIVTQDQQVFDEVSSISKDCIMIAKQDWDEFETSWDFVRHPLVQNVASIKEAYENWKNVRIKRFNRIKENEERLNQIFIDIYQIKEGITPNVDDDNITMSIPDITDDIKSFISYAVGCMMGRYSLNEDGLIYSGGKWEESKYITFPADKDGILPICDDEYFDDDITGLFINFVETVYGTPTLEENLKFIAEAIGGKGSPRQVIRNYFINDFYTDHCATYSVTGSGKRPIYWLFDSGKKNGFKCLVYMHRYKPDTVARIRTDYVHEQQSRYRTAITGLERQIADASTSERVRLNKRLSTLKDQAEEIFKYEEKIHHLADQMISIDLDDGVKHNYEIFKDVLAKIK